VVSLKERKPYLSHRQVSGFLRHAQVWVSASTCYRILRPLGLVFTRAFREAPWKTSRYEPFRPNQLWAEDWTGLTILGLRFYLLTLMDLFSRYIVAWGVVRTVTSREVRNLLALGIMSQGIDTAPGKPTLRTDPGSPNMAGDFRAFLTHVGIRFSPGRVNRPTDNGRQERFYRTVKQEEIYCYPTYPSEEIARKSLSRYIAYYNEERPHQALWGFTPAYVHTVGNKALLLEEHRLQVRRAQAERIRQNSLMGKGKLTPSSA
jgi:transposase InsO family protein